MGVRIRAQLFVVCLTVCAFSFPPFAASISLRILSVYFWNNERRAPLFVFPHRNQSWRDPRPIPPCHLCSPPSPAAPVDSSRSLWMSWWMGWIPQHIPGKRAGLVSLLAEPGGSRFSFFPAFFIPFFLIFTSLGCSELFVPWFS